VSEVRNYVDARTPEERAADARIQMTTSSTTTQNNPLKIGDKVDRISENYRFPGTIVSLFTPSNGGEYAVVEMDNFLLLHIFKVKDLKRL